MMSRLSLFLVLTAFTVNAATYYVAPNGAEDASCLSPSDAGTLKAAYALATDATSESEGDEIVLLPGEYDGSSGGGHLPLTISKKYLTIRSSANTPNNTVFVGGGSAGGGLSAFTTSLVEGGPTIKYLTFTNFYQSSNYAVILNATVLGDASAVGCVFRNNYGKYGIVRFASAINSRFIGNTGVSAAAVMQGSADGCYFENNSSSSFGSCYACTRLDNCTFTNNVSTTPVVFGSSIDGLVVSNCLFVGNRGGEKGGAIRYATVYDSVFVTNCAGSGGGIFEANAYRCYFTNNIATVNNGGATYASSCYDCHFDSNRASKSGGASYAGGYYVNCYFTNNISPNYKTGGGAIYGSASTVISNCIFIANRSMGSSCMGGAVEQALAVYDSVFITNCALGGGALSTVTSIYRSYFTNNVATSYGGATYASSCYDCVFSQNFASGSGGAVRFGGNIFNCYFTNNIANGYKSSGGAIYGTESMVVSNCTFIENRAFYGSSNSGGAVALVKEIHDSTFIDNDSYTAGAVDRGKNIYRSLFKDNYATSFGGAVYASSCYDCIFDSNSSPGSGGAVRDGISVMNCFFTNNASTGNKANGGGISTATIVSNCTFIANSAIQYGGGIYNADAYDCTFIANNANSGGGGTFDKGAVRCDYRDNTSSAYGGGSYNTIPRDCTYIDNYAPRGGGAAIGSACNITNITFIGNEGTLAGGIWAPSASTFWGCIFSRNSATTSASIAGSNTGPTSWKGYFFNCLITENHSSTQNKSYGRLVTGHSVFVNCTIVSNKYSVSGVSYAPVSGVFTNSLLHGNASYDAESSTLVNCIYGTIDEATAVANEDSFQLADPLFNPNKVEGHPFYLHRASKGVDAGIPVPEVFTADMLDLGGAKRIKGRTIDIGAYETLGPGMLFSIR